MARAIKNAVWETFVTTGTGAITPTGAVPGKGAQTFASAFSSGDTMTVTAEKNGQRQTFLATWNGTTLARTTTEYSSSGGVTDVDFLAGTGTVFVDVPASYQQASLFSQYAASVVDWGANRSTNPLLKLDFSASSVATGLKILGAAAGAALALSVISSGTNESLTIDAKGSGTITLGGTSTGNVVILRALTYGGVALSNAVTGAGNMVLSAGPTFTGTLAAAAATFSSTVGITGALTYGGVALSAAVTGTGNMVLSASPTITGTLTAATINASGVVTLSAGVPSLTLSTTNGANNNVQMRFHGGSNNADLWAVGTDVAGGSGSKDFHFYNLTNSLVALTVSSAVSNAGTVTVGYSTASSSTSTGALVVSGGLGVGGNIVGGGTFGTIINDPIAARTNGIVLNQGGGFAIYCRTGTAWEIGLSSTTGNHMLFYTDNGSAFVAAGSINSSGSTTTYTTASDERLKMKFDEDDIDWGDRIDRMWVGAYQMKADPGQWRLGIRAQQAHGIAPQGVTRPRAGDKDDTYRVDYGLALAPLAMWGVKDLRRRLHALEQRLAA